jgi:hypothetical protein
MKLLAETDPGHGWLRVPIKLLERLNIVDKISRYSYKAAGYAFLEEDCDWSVFHCAMEKYGIEYTIDHKHVNYDSPIREYQPFK